MVLGISLLISGLSCLICEMELVIPASECCHRNYMGLYRIKNPSSSLEHMTVSVQMCDLGCLKSHHEWHSLWVNLAPFLPDSFWSAGGSGRGTYKARVPQSIRGCAGISSLTELRWHSPTLGMRGPGWLPKHTHLPKIICHFLPSPLSCFSVILDVWPVLPGSRWLRGKESASQCKTLKSWRFNPWAGKDFWRKKWQPTPLFLPREPHGQRSLVGYSPWGHKESNTAERLSAHACTSLIKQVEDHTCHSVGLWIRPLSTQTMCL